MIKELFGNKYVILILDYLLEDVMDDIDNLVYYSVYKATIINSENIELVTDDEIKCFDEAVELLIKYGVFEEKSNSDGREEYYLNSKWYYILLQMYYEMQIHLPENETEIKFVTRFI